MANSLYLRLLWMLFSIYKSSSAIEGDSFDCDFEDGFCNWKQDKTDDFDWTRLSGETLTDGTGPDSDHTSGDGFYVYIETTRYDAANYTARLISPQKDPGQYCFSFWYHMYGRHINTFSVSKKEGTDTEELFWKTGDQGKQWILGQIRFVAEKSFQIVIEGKARDHKETWFGDIAVDDILLFPIEKCQTAIDRDSFNCSFDDGFCNWEQDKTDDFDWKRLSGTTPTDKTGPEFDRTSGAGFYVYIETTPKENNLRKMDNYEARLISPQKDPGHYCFSFWYHMYGRDINRLSISKKEGTDINELFSKAGDQAKQWVLGQIEFVAENSFQIVIEGKARNHKWTWLGDIAVDDIALFPTEKCPKDCGDPNTETGVANSVSIEFGSPAQIKCKTGYEIAENSSITCLVNGSWIERPVCQPIDCMMPTFNSGISVNTLEGTTYNMTVILNCVDGFTLIGNASITCQADGNWTIQPYCVINNCSDPTPESGDVDGANFQYGSVIEVTCIEGYKINGNSSIMCQENSTWNSIPVCDKIECETMNITNGHFNTTLGTTFGKTATQYCDSGYTFAGDETVTCLEAGWNGTIATCTIVDSEASALVVVYAMVPVIVIVLTLVVLFVIWRKKHAHCAKAKNSHHISAQKPKIQYESETCHGYGLRNQDHVSETSEPIPQDEEYSFITDHNKAEPTDNTYYNTFDNNCKVENDVENQYDHTNDTSKPFSNNIYSHISRKKSDIQDETTYDTASCQNSVNKSLNTKAQTGDDSYSHLDIEGLKQAIHLKPQTTIQEEESEYANAAGNIDAVESELNAYSHLNEVKMKTKTVEKEANSPEDCEYSNVVKRTGDIETTGE